MRLLRPSEYCLKRLQLRLECWTQRPQKIVLPHLAPMDIRVYRAFGEHFSPPFLFRLPLPLLGPCSFLMGASMDLLPAQHMLMRQEAAKLDEESDQESSLAQSASLSSMQCHALVRCSSRRAAQAVPYP